MAYRLFNHDDRQASLLDLVDNVVHQGVVLHGDLMLGLAGVDLIYAQLSLLLAAAERGTGRVDDRAGTRATRPRDMHLLPAAQAQRKPVPPRATRKTRGPTQQPAGPRRRR